MMFEKVFEIQQDWLICHNGKFKLSLYLNLTASLIPIVPDTDVGETDSNVDDVADAPVKVTVKTTPAPVLEPVDDNVKTDPGQTETDDVTAVDDGVGSPGPVNEIEEPDTNGDSENDFETPGHESEEDINLEIEDGSFDTKSSTDDKSHPDMPPMDTDGKNLDAAEVNSPDLGMPGKESILTGKTYFHPLIFKSSYHQFL